jgi:type II secretory pathway component GspD/PulD (secretin)
MVLLTVSGKAQSANFDYQEPTDIKVAAAHVAKHTGKVLIIDRNVNGKFQLGIQRDLSNEELWSTFTSVLDQLGLVAMEYELGIYNIIPKRIEDLRSFSTAPSWFLTGLISKEEVSFSFPNPTEIKEVITELSQETGLEFVLDRNVNGKVQILANKPVSHLRATQMVYMALQQLGLGVKSTGVINLVMPIRRIEKDSNSYRTNEYTNKDARSIRIAYDSPTDIKDIAKGVQEWSGKNFFMDRNVNGKVQILTTKDHSSQDAYNIFYASLTMLGLTTDQRDNHTSILPIRVKRKNSQN